MIKAYKDFVSILKESYEDDYDEDDYDEDDYEDDYDEDSGYLDIETYNEYRQQYFEERDADDVDALSDEDWDENNWEGWDYMDSQESDYVSSTGTPVMYHASPKDFDYFDSKLIGSSSGTDGAGGGIYFSDSLEDVYKYGDYIYKCKLNLKKGLSNNKVTIDKQTLLNIIDIYDKLGRSYFEGFGRDTNIEDILEQTINGNDDDAEILSSVVNGVGGSWDIACDILSRMQINHITEEKPYGKDNDYKHIIMYNMIDIEIIEKMKKEDLKKEDN